MKNILKKILNIVLPSRCPYCGKTVIFEHTLCESCFNQINFISAPYCKICGMPFENEKEANLSKICAKCASQKHITRLNRSAIIYDDFSKKLILDFKFYAKTQNANILAKWLYAAGKDIFEEGVDLIMPVPLSYRRLFGRGYNQSAILARLLSKQTKIEADVFNLKKIKHTKPQSSLSGKSRLKNVKNVFEVKAPEKIKGKRIVLIDDVLTTGATLAECAKVLLKNGAASVDTLTVARVKNEE